MPLLKAHRVSFFLASGGFNSVKKIAEIQLDELRKMRDEPNARFPEALRRSGYVAKDAEDGTVTVEFQGSDAREPGMLRMYRDVLVNCGYTVDVLDDESRPGRQILKVVTG